MFKKTLLAAITGSSILLGGCLGQNALFDTVQDWNATATNNKFVNQGISFAFWFLPVYGLTLLGDIVIFNSIEFWTGSNPISHAGPKVSGGSSRTVTDGLGNSAEMTFNLDGSVDVIEHRDGMVFEYSLSRDGNNVIVSGNSPSVVATL